MSDTLSSVDRFVRPMGPVQEFMGNEPLFAEGTGLPVLPTYIESDKATRSGTSRLEISIESDSFGRFTGAVILERAVTGGPDGELRTEINRYWADDTNNSDYYESQRNPDGTEEEVEVHRQDGYFSVTDLIGGQRTVQGSMDVSRDTGEVVWRIDHRHGQDEARRSADGRLQFNASSHGYEHDATNTGYLVEATFAYDADGSLRTVVQPRQGFNGKDREIVFSRIDPGAVEAVTYFDPDPENKFVGGKELRNYDDSGRLQSISAHSKFTLIGTHVAASFEYA